VISDAIDTAFKSGLVRSGLIKGLSDMVFPLDYQLIAS